MLFITHNLPLVRGIADYAMVLRRGKVVEEGTTEDVFSRPSDPYTRSLLTGDLDLSAEHASVLEP